MAKKKKPQKGKREPKVEPKVEAPKVEGVTVRLKQVEPEETPEAGQPSREPVSIEPTINILARSEDAALSHVVGSINIIFGLNALKDALDGKVDKNLKMYYEDTLYRATGLALMHYEELIRNHNLDVEKILTRMFEDYRDEYHMMRDQNPMVPEKTDQEIMDVCAKVLYTVDQIHKKITEEVRTAVEASGDKNGVEQRPA